jgi:hypothetical protein
VQRANIHCLEARPSTFTSLNEAKLTKEGHRKVQRANIHSLEARPSTFTSLNEAKLTKEGHRKVQRANQCCGTVTIFYGSGSGSYF